MASPPADPAELPGQAEGKTARPPLVSVIMPVRNGEQFIERALKSALSQTYPWTEIIVIDDGSTDHTAGVCAGFKNRIRLTRQEPRGLSAARNAGISASRGELIAFLDADDLWFPQKLERQVAIFKEDPSCAMLSGEVLTIDANDRIIGHWKKSDLGRRIRDRFEDLYEGNYFHVPTVILRRECLTVVGEFREDLDTTEDYDLWLRVARRYRFRYIEEPLAAYRLHEGQLTGDERKLERRIQNNIRVLTQPPVAEGMSWLKKRIRTAKVYSQYARLYERHGLTDRAAETFLRALRTWPFLRTGS